MSRNIVDQSRMGPSPGVCSSFASTVSAQPATLYKYIIYIGGGWADGHMPWRPASGAQISMAAADNLPYANGLNWTSIHLEPGAMVVRIRTIVGYPN